MPFALSIIRRSWEAGSGSRRAAFRLAHLAAPLSAMALLAGIVAACGSAPASTAAIATSDTPATSAAPVTSAAPATSGTPATSVAPVTPAAPAAPSPVDPDTICTDAAPGLEGTPVTDAEPDPGAAPYAASDAPAPVYFSSVYDFDSTSPNTDGGLGLGADSIYAQDGLLIISEGNADEPSAWSVNDPSQVQLIACVTGQDTSASSPQAKPCAYGVAGLAEPGQSSSIPVYKEKYTITLYVARTGKPLTSRTVVGSDANVCPNSVITDNGSPDISTPLTTILTINDIASVIGKYASA